MQHTFAGIRSPSDPCVANAVRRTVLADVRTLAPCAVTFRLNDSVMSDKQLAHRISLVVLAREAAGADEPDLELACAAADKQTVVSASALRAPDGVRIATPNVPLVILGPGQSIDATVHTRVAGGGEHARFCPAEIVGYRPGAAGVTLTVEPTGAMPAREVLAAALDALCARVDRCVAQVRAAC